MTDPLDNLSRHGAEVLTPCVLCNRTIAEIGMPIFYRITVQHMGIDTRAASERAGLAMVLGGSTALADAMGAHQPPVVEFDTGIGNVCLFCQQKEDGLMHLTHCLTGK